MRSYGELGTVNIPAGTMPTEVNSRFSAPSSAHVSPWSNSQVPTGALKTPWDVSYERV